MESEIGRFVQWGAAVSVDTARRLLRILPIAENEQVVEFDCEDCPDTDQLDIRVSSL